MMEQYIIQSFNTHRMDDKAITALMTGRQKERNIIIQQVEANLRQGPGELQHVIIYGPRGFGKSFLVRMAQVELEKRAREGAPLAFVLLPEEQHNLVRSPSGLLDYLALELEDLRNQTDRSWEGAMFRWPNPETAEANWREAKAALDAELDKHFESGPGLAVVVVENFDFLLSTVFKDDVEQQLLRKWMTRKGNRCMLLATATGAVDIDYDRPLFQAFRPINLKPWTPQDCIDYFNRRRAFDGRAPLDDDEKAKALAISNFIGGTPRLAQLLADVFDVGTGFKDGEPLSVVAIMNAMVDKLADYYRRRINDLPPLAQGLLDALIRGGEPCSATELAARVHADGQNIIARVIADLVRADMIRGVPAPDGREKLYSATDRVFVHFYRVRQGHSQAIDSPLATIIDFLRAFYTPAERKQQALRYMEAGRTDEADFFARLAREAATPADYKGYFRYFRERLARCLSVAPPTWLETAEDVENSLKKPAEVIDRYKNLPAPATKIEASIRSVILAQAYARMGLVEKAEEVLNTACRAAKGNPEATLVTASEFGVFLRNVPGNTSKAKYFLALAGDQADRIASPLLRSAALRYRAISFKALSRHEKAIATATEAATLAAKAGDKGMQSAALRVKADSLDLLGRYQRSIATATKAATLAAEAGDKRRQALALLYKAFTLGKLYRHKEGIQTFTKAIELATETGDFREVAMANLELSLLLEKLNHTEDAFAHAAEAWIKAMEIGDEVTAREAADQAIKMAQDTPQAEVIELLGQWIDKQALVGKKQAAIPSRLIADFLAAATRARTWPALDTLLERHSEWLAERIGPSFNPIGDVIASVAADEGRAAGFDAAQGILSRLAQLHALRPERSKRAYRLAEIIQAFAEQCRDAGLLRDVAGLLTKELSPDAPLQGRLLESLADFEAAGDRQSGVLARMDPDIARLIRVIRDLPEDAAASSKKGRRNKKKGKRG